MASSVYLVTVCVGDSDNDVFHLGSAEGVVCRQVLYLGSKIHMLQQTHVTILYTLQSKRSLRTKDISLHICISSEFYS